MDFVGLDAFLCCVGAVNIRWGVLVLGPLGCDEIFNVRGCLVVQLVGFWFEPTCVEIGVDLSV